MSFHLQMKILSLKDLLSCLSILWAGHPKPLQHSYIHFLREEPSHSPQTSNWNKMELVETVMY